MGIIFGLGEHRMTFKHQKADCSTNNALTIYISKACTSLLGALAKALARAMAKAAPSGRRALRASSLLAGAAVSLLLLVGAGTAAAQTTNPSLSIGPDTDENQFNLQGGMLYYVIEGDHAAYIISISAAQTADVTVPISVTEEKSRYLIPPLPTSVTIPAGETIASLSIATEDDNRNEVSFGFIAVSISNPDTSMYTLGTSTASTIYVWDTLDGLPKLTVADASAEEGSPLEFVVSLSAESENTVTTDYLTENIVAGGGINAAGDGSDYTRITQATLTFPPRTSKRTITVTTLADTDVEPEETMRLRLNNLRLADFAAGGTFLRAEGTILDSLTIASIKPGVGSVTESSGEKEFTVTLSRAPASDTSITITSADGTATAPADYTAISETITVKGGESTTTFTVTVVSDNLVEGAERFTVTATLQATPPHTLEQEIVINDVGLFPIGFIDPQQTTSEAATLAANAAGCRMEDGMRSAAPCFTVGALDTSLTLASEFVVTLTTNDVRGIANAATADEDYAPINVRLTFNRTVTRIDVPITLFNDEVYENPPGSGSDNEVFEGQLTSVTVGPNVVLNPRRSRVSITEDPADTAPEISVADATAAKVAMHLEFTVSMTRAAGYSITVDYATSDGTAVDGTDYTAASDTLTFAPGETMKVVQVPLLATTDTDDKTLTLALTNPMGGATISSTAGSAMGTIADLPALSIAADKTSYMENELASITISITKQQTTPVVVPLTVTAETDYVLDDTTLPTSVTIPANSSTTVLSIAFDDDMRQDDTTQVTMTIRSPDPTAYGIANERVTVSVVDDGDAEPTINLGAAPDTSRGEPMIFTVTLSTQSDRTVTVSYATSDGTAEEADGDYTPTGGDLTFLPRETTKMVEVPTSMTADDGETVFLVLASGQAATIATSAVAGVSGTIIELPTLSIVASTGTVAESAGAEFTVRINVAQAQDLAVPLTVSQTGDFLDAPPGSVTIPAGQTSVNLTIALEDDTADEDNGSITVTISNPDANLYALPMATASASVTVEDDDAEPTVLVKAVADAREGESLLFLVSLSAASGKTVSVSYTTEDGTATAGEDYMAASGQLTFQPDATEQTVAVPTIRDTVSDPDETLHLVLATPTNASLGMQASTHRATGAIVEGLDEEAAQQLSEAILPYVASALGSVTSRALQSRTKVALSGNSSGGLSVRGSSLSQFLVAQAKTGGDPALLNRGLSQAPGMHPGALGAALPYTSLDQWQAQADARAATGSQRHPSLGIGDLDFTMALSGGGQGQQSADGSLNLWGSGYYTDFANDEGPAPIEGKVTGGMIGIDMLYSGWLMGVAVNLTQTDVDWDYEDFTGSYEITLTGFHPYFARQLDKYTQVWVSLGHEQGEAEIAEDGRPDLCPTCKFDVTMNNVALGISSQLREIATKNGMAKINFISDGSYSHIKGDTQQAVTATSSWLRLGVEMDYQRNLTGNTHLDGGVELVMRSDFDARRGTGLELGGNLDLVLPAQGLHLDLAVRTLLVHSADVDEWGISGGIRWAVRKGGKGLSLAFKPQWGALGSARDALWEQGLSSDFKRNQADAAGRYSLELTYGLPILHGQELLTLFTRSNYKADGRDLSLGADLNLGQHFSSGYEMLMRQGATSVDLARDAEHRAFIRYQRSF